MLILQDFNRVANGNFCLMNQNVLVHVFFSRAFLTESNFDAQHLIRQYSITREKFMVKLLMKWHKSVVNLGHCFTRAIALSGAIFEECVNIDWLICDGNSNYSHKC